MFETTTQCLGQNVLIKIHQIEISFERGQNLLGLHFSI